MFIERLECFWKRVVYVCGGRDQHRVFLVVVGVSDWGRKIGRSGFRTGLAGDVESQYFAGACWGSVVLQYGV